MSRRRVNQGLLLAAALVNLLPVAGILSAGMLARAYGIAQPTGDLLILMQHRALLFALVGGLLAVSAYKPNLQPVAVTIGLVSMVGFVVLWLIGSPAGPELQRIAIIDAVASVALVIVIGLRRSARIASVPGPQAPSFE